MTSTISSNEIIRTPRLTIEPFGDEHPIGILVGWLNDSEVVRYSDQRHRTHTLESSQAYYKSFAGSPNHYWAIMANTSMIGTLTAYVDEPNSVADVGILVGDKRCWRGGYGSEAFRAVVNWLITHRGMRKITAGTMAENMAMRGVMRKIGMHEEGRRERYYILDGREVDMVYATVFAEEWDHISLQSGR
ncbi:MAG: GNAT family N-acetyltransferase [Kiritimatiellae bacterium]|nr:GNAT family N-acetyltransferase [Verrucomicrobiota bacterium]MCG2680948.1 GNAT family N-acetyltransferase [Kiritimatiellia bacterium]